MAKLAKEGTIPPCPDPKLYVLITTKEGSYWRLKRGTVKPAPVNQQLRDSSERMKVTSPAAKKIVAALSHHLRDLEVGRLTVRIGALLGKSLKADGRMSYQHFQGYDFQPYHPLQELAHFGMGMERTDTHLRLKIRMTAGDPMLLKEYGPDTQCRFTMVVVKGDPGDELRTASMTSPAYPVVPKADGECILSVVMPPGDQPWFLCLKVQAVEGGVVKEEFSAKGAQIMVVG